MIEKIMNIREERLGYLLIVLSAAGFSTLPILSKIAFESGLSLPTVLFFRFFIGTIVIWTVFGLRGNLRILRGKNFIIAVGLGAVGYALMSAFYLWGLDFITAGLVSVILYTYPIFVVLISAFKLKENITNWIILALILTFSGITLIMRFDPAGVDPRGIIIVMLSSVVYSIYITLSRKTLLTVDTGSLTSHVIPAAALSFLIYGLLTDQLFLPMGVIEWGCLLGVAVLATAIPIFSFFAGLSRIGASRASIVSTLEPPLTVLLGVLILGERFNLAMLFGGGAVLAGVIIVQVKG